MSNELLELTGPQKSIYFTEQFFSDTSINNICGTLYIKERVDFKLLEKALNIFIQNNDSFNFKFKLDDGVMKQYLSHFVEFSPPLIDINNNNDLNKLQKELNDLPFNLYDSLLYRISLFRLPDNTGGFTICVHHLISDAWSFGLVIDEVIDIYSKLLKNENSFEKYPSYIEYINSEQDYIKSDKFKKDKEFWQKSFSTLPEIAKIPGFSVQSNSTLAKRKQFILDQKFLNSVNDFCEKNKISIYNFLMAIFAIYIGRVSNLDDFVIGTPVLNRSNFKEKHMTGMFISTIPLRIKIENSLKFTEFAKNLSDDLFSIYRHQKYSYENILQDVRKLDPSIPNLYDILISYQNMRSSKQESKIDFSSHWAATDHIASGINIHFFNIDNENHLDVAYDYQVSKYSEDDIINMHNRILYIIKQVISKKQIILNNIEIITPEEKHLILDVFNNTLKNYPKDKDIFETIANTALEFPNRIAVETATDQITYEDLINTVYKLCNYLISKNVTLNSNIGIVVNRNIETIVGILAILKLGGTIVPIDSGYPVDRINKIVKDADLRFILYQNDELNIDTPVNYVNIAYSSYSKESTIFNYSFNNNIERNLYIIFTSGSTGTPKGATISHKNMLNLIYFEKNCKAFPISNSRILQFATMSFDVSYQEIFSALLFGSTLVIVDEFIKKNSDMLLDYIIKKKINILFMPPAYLRILADTVFKLNKKLTDLKHIITAGEQLVITDSIKKLIENKNITIHNHYGPAETHVVTTYTVTKDNITIKPPIGKPIYNTKIYILDKNKHISPINIPGEIYIYGDCVGNGYINNRKLTNASFVHLPFEKGIFYKTGDIGVVKEDGSIYYLGRADFQCKINGFRIEIEEVEKAIISLPYISNAAVIIREIDNYGKHLVACVEANSDEDIKNIKSDLRKKLPEYMIPHNFIRLDKIALNMNGKVDKKLLKSYISSMNPIIEENKEKELPHNEVQYTLLELFKKLLDNKFLDINDNFFDNGGDSLLAIRLQAEALQKKLRFSTQDVYNNPSVKELSKCISLDNAQNTSTDDSNEPQNLKLLPKDIVLKGNLNILLTGVTGFLSIHMLQQLLATTNHTIYCIIRPKSSENSIDRIRKRYIYYFSDDIDKYINSGRLYIFDGDLSRKNFNLTERDYKTLLSKIDIVINSAASVKHYGKREESLNSNVTIVQNLIDFCEKNNSVLNHISTIGIAGNDLTNTNCCFKDTFDENDLYIGQNYKSNVYVETKYIAEKLILGEINLDKINANIIRVGNLMNRYSDNKFQINADSNAFQNRILSFLLIKEFPMSLKKFSFDLTPVDVCADAIIKLVLYNKCNNIYHVFNSKKISSDYIANIFKSFGIDMNYVENKDFFNDISNIVANSKSDNLKWIINDTEDLDAKRINVLSSKTENTLQLLDFNWNTVDNSYYSRVTESIIRRFDSLGTK